jgi:hypothetical protein
MLELSQAQETVDNARGTQGPAAQASASSARLAIRDHAAGSEIETIMAAYHRFIAHVALGDRQAAWVYLQDALTLMIALLGKPFQTFEDEAGAYRVYSMLYVTCLLLDILGGGITESKAVYCP